MHRWRSQEEVDWSIHLWSIKFKIDCSREEVSTDSSTGVRVQCCPPRDGPAPLRPGGWQPPGHPQLQRADWRGRGQQCGHWDHEHLPLQLQTVEWFVMWSLDIKWSSSLLCSQLIVFLALCNVEYAYQYFYLLPRYFCGINLLWNFKSISEFCDRFANNFEQHYLVSQHRQ